MSASVATLGAVPTESGTRFSVWTTTAKQVQVRLFADETRVRRELPLEPRGEGLFEATFSDVAPGALYKIVLDGTEVGDPYARFLPFGVFGPAEVIAAVPAEKSLDRPPLSQLVLYELHVGTFTPEGTYRAASQKLKELAGLGINAIELMPLSAFPGQRGWGYDGVAPFAPYAGYGRPEDLRDFVRAAHALGIRVLLDAVYNHFGPSGNWLGSYSPDYFAADRLTPWGPGPRFDHPRLRALVLDSVRWWLEQYGFDGLRLDATHEIQDPSSVHVLREIHQLAAGLTPPRLVTAEDDRNSAALVLEDGLDALWADDFHHQIATLLVGDRDGYYAAYDPTLTGLARCINQGWTYAGQVYPPWKRGRGTSAAGLRPEQLVYCTQNHDQVGNRALGTRFSHDAPLAAEQLATGLLLFLPATPLLFMGQEWSASTPFLYFTDHAGELGGQVSEGRRKEFAGFKAFATEELRQHIPDPQAQSTFERSKLRWEERLEPGHRETLELVRALLRLRREDPVLQAPSERKRVKAEVFGEVLMVRREAASGSAAGTRTFIGNFGPAPARLPVAPGKVLLTIGALEGDSLAGYSALILAG